jgi:hypothetical protein
MLRVARINKKTNIVVNIEECSKQWFEQNKSDDETFLIAYDSNNVAFIGFFYDKETEKFLKQN